MKKLLSLVLSVAMLMTVACSMFVMPASADDNTINFMLEEYVVEGTENVTFNEDGTWTITGDIALAPRTTFDYTVFKYIEFVMESDVDVLVQFLDRDPVFENGEGAGYGEHYITLESEWHAKNGGYFAPVDGVISYTGTEGDLHRIYNWLTNPENGSYCNWTNTGTCTARAIYIKLREAGTVTLKQLNMWNGVAPLEDIDLGTSENTYNTTVDLAVKDAAAWSTTAAMGQSDAVVTVDGDNLVLSNTAGLWPSAYVNFETPYVVDANAMLELDFTVHNFAATTIYIYCANSDAVTYTEGEYITVNVADMTQGNYTGIVNLADYAGAACANEDGTYTINAIRIYATTAGGAADVLDPAVTIRTLNLLYTAEEEQPPVEEPLMGDVNGDDSVNVNDAIIIYKAFAGTGALTDEQAAVADYNADGAVNINDAIAIYKVVAGV